MKTSMYVAASLDGFIARPDGDMRWLGNTDTELQDFGYQEFYRSVDCLVMGGKTYRKIRSSDGWFYHDKPVWVYSRRPFTPDIPNVFHTDAPPAGLVRQLKDEGRRHLWVLGGGEIHSMFLRDGLIDRIRLFVMPLALGEGIPLFAPPLPERRWRLADMKQWSGDLAELHYERERDDAKA